MWIGFMRSWASARKRMRSSSSSARHEKVTSAGTVGDCATFHGGSPFGCDALEVGGLGGVVLLGYVVITDFVRRASKVARQVRHTLRPPPVPLGKNTVGPGAAPQDSQAKFRTQGGTTAKPNGSRSGFTAWPAARHTRGARRRPRWSAP